jgi:hypothetical protein
MRAAWARRKEMRAASGGRKEMRAAWARRDGHDTPGLGSLQAPPGARARCSLGVGVDGGHTVVLIPAGAPIPAAGRMLFTTVADAQPAVEIPVMRVSGVPPRAVPIGRFLLSGFAVGRRGRPRIEVSLAVDGSGTLRARARDVAGGASQEVTFARGFPEETGAASVTPGSARGGARLLVRAS